jgi:transposase
MAKKTRKNLQALHAEVAKRLDPFQADIDRLDTIPGIARRTAEQMSFHGFQVQPTFARGSVLCQDTTKVPVDEKPRKLAKETNISDRHFLKLHNPYADLTIISEPYTGESQHVKGRKAAVAVAHAIMKIAYHLLIHNEDYRDLGADYFEKRQQDFIVKQSVRRLENLGFTVTIATPDDS